MKLNVCLNFYDEVYKTFNLSYHIELSTRPEKKYIGDLKTWNLSEKALAKACITSGILLKLMKEMVLLRPKT